MVQSAGRALNPAVAIVVGGFISDLFGSLFD